MKAPFHRHSDKIRTIGAVVRFVVKTGCGIDACEWMEFPGSRIILAGTPCNRWVGAMAEVIVGLRACFCSLNNRRAMRIG
jgi:hypothetical protein